MRVQRFSGAVIVLVATSAVAQTPSASPNPPNSKPPQSPAPRVYSSSYPVVDVCDVLAKYAALTHLKITRDNFVQGKVSIDDVSGLDKAKAIEIIERTLFS